MDGYIIKLNKDIELDITEIERSITRYYIIIYDKNKRSEIILTRDDPDIVVVIEQLGESANGSHAELKVVEIPDGVDWEINAYDGVEWIAEKHRKWC